MRRSATYGASFVGTSLICVSFRLKTLIHLYIFIFQGQEDRQEYLKLLADTDSPTQTSINPSVTGRPPLPRRNYLSGRENQLRIHLPATQEEFDTDKDEDPIYDTVPCGEDDDYEDISRITSIQQRNQVNRLTDSKPPTSRKHSDDRKSNESNKSASSPKVKPRSPLDVTTGSNKLNGHCKVKVKPPPSPKYASRQRHVSNSDESDHRDSLENQNLSSKISHFESITSSTRAEIERSPLNVSSRSLNIPPPSPKLKRASPSSSRNQSPDRSGEPPVWIKSPPSPLSPKRFYKSNENINKPDQNGSSDPGRKGVKHTGNCRAIIGNKPASKDKNQNLCSSSSGSDELLNSRQRNDSVTSLPGLLNLDPDLSSHKGEKLFSKETKTLRVILPGLEHSDSGQHVAEKTSRSRYPKSIVIDEPIFRERLGSSSRTPQTSLKSENNRERTSSDSSNSLTSSLSSVSGSLKSHTMNIPQGGAVNSPVEHQSTTSFDEEEDKSSVFSASSPLESSSSSLINGNDLQLSLGGQEVLLGYGRKVPDDFNDPDTSNGNTYGDNVQVSQAHISYR